MLSIPPLAWFLGCLRSFGVALCAAVLLSGVALSSAAAARPIAYPAKHGKDCKPGTRATSAAPVASARRAGVHRVIKRDRRAITRLRSRHSCRTRHRPRSGANKQRGPLDPNRTQITSDADQALFQQWIDAASRAGAPTPIGSVEVVNAGCPKDTGPREAVPACTGLDEPIYLEPAMADRQQAFYHELGHHLWYRIATAQRDEFMALIGRAGEPYRQTPNSPHEQFAEAYRVVVDVALHGPNTHKAAAYGLVVDNRRWAQLTALIKRTQQNTAQRVA